MEERGAFEGAGQETGSFAVSDIREAGNLEEHATVVDLLELSVGGECGAKFFHQERIVSARGGKVRRRGEGNGGIDGVEKVSDSDNPTWRNVREGGCCVLEQRSGDSRSELVVTERGKDEFANRSAGAKMAKKEFNVGATLLGEEASEAKAAR